MVKSSFKIVYDITPKDYKCKKKKKKKKQTNKHTWLPWVKEQTHYCLYASASALYCDAKSL